MQKSTRNRRNLWCTNRTKAWHRKIFYQITKNIPLHILSVSILFLLLNITSNVVRTYPTVNCNGILKMLVIWCIVCLEKHYFIRVSFVIFFYYSLQRKAMLDVETKISVPCFSLALVYYISIRPSYIKK